jgi:hypothetical protein
MKKTISLILVLTLGLAAEVANADFIIGTLAKLPQQVNLPGYTSGAPSISADGLSLFFTSDMPGQYGNYDLWVTTRAAIGDDWGVPVNLGPTVNSSASESYPDISSDGLSLFFQDGHPLWPEVPLRPGGCGLGDLWVTKRETLADAWGTPENLGPTVNGPYWDGTPCISADDLVLYFASNRPGGSGDYDIWLAMRKTKDEDWGEPVNLGPTVNSTDWEYGVSVSSDGLALFLMSTGSGGHGGCDLWMTTRVGKGQEWVAPVNLGPTVNSSIWEYKPSISACFPGSGCRLYFTRRPGMDPPSIIYEAKINPVVDLNTDGIVDATDMCIMVDNWDTNNQLCDIGPMPWGDGIIDVQDLIVLAEHLFEDYRLIAHWKLDETEGIVAQDSAGNNDAFLMGDPAWQPQGGIVDGTILLDGVDDCIITNSVLNPAEGPFSVFTWIKGGAPGQTVLSQIGGANWLCIDSLEGNLMTLLQASSRSGKPLQSQTVITDGNWHRVGFVWDGSHRTLYVDGVAVAEDTQSNLEGSNDGLYLGCGKAMDVGTYWSGMLDDVRIYNQALSEEKIAALVQ